MPASTGFDDPDLPPTPTEEHRFPCDTCGSDLRFDPERYLLVCDHCGNTEEISGTRGLHNPIAELDFQAALASALPQSQMEDTRVTTCPNCAAQVEFDPGKHATECPFCATPVVIDTGVNRHIKPLSLIHI